MKAWEFQLTLLVVAQSVYCAISPSPLQTVKQWNFISYNFRYNSEAMDPDVYSPMNILATGIAVGRDRIYIATPKLFSGVSATVSSISRAEFGDSPVLEAYPDWSYHTPGRQNITCSDLQLISVYRLRIDSCNRLWVLDAGISRSLEDYENTCPPKILIFDLNTNRVVRRIDFPREVLRGESLFTNLIVDETTSRPGNNCDDVFVYITDTVEPGIIVYDSQRDVTWRVSHPAMYPDPDFAQSEIQGHKFILMDGIVGLTFDEKKDLIYFQPLATDRVFSVTKQVLRAGPIPINQVLPVRLVGKKSSQGIGLAVSPIDQSIIFSPMTETALASYNPSTNEQTIFAYDPDRLQFVADIATSAFDYGAVYALSSKFHRFFLKNVDGNEVNNRILRIELQGSRSQPQPATIRQQFSQYQSNHLESRPAATYQSSSSNSRVFAGVSQPFQFEPVGLVNKGITNPFTALNQGESYATHPVVHRHLSGSLARQYLSPSYGASYNFVRVAKSIAENSTAIH